MLQGNKRSCKAWFAYNGLLAETPSQGATVVTPATAQGSNWNVVNPLNPAQLWEWKILRPAKIELHAYRAVDCTTRIAIGKFCDCHTKDWLLRWSMKESDRCWCCCLGEVERERGGGGMGILWQFIIKKLSGAVTRIELNETWIYLDLYLAIFCHIFLF